MFKGPRCLLQRNLGNVFPQALKETEFCSCSMLNCCGNLGVKMRGKIYKEQKENKGKLTHFLVN